MDNKIEITNLRWYPQATVQQLERWKDELLEKDCGTLIILPNPADPEQYLGILLAKYHTSALSACIGVRDTQFFGPFVVLAISGLSVRGFISSIMRKLRPYCPVTPVDNQDADSSGLWEVPDMPELPKQAHAPRMDKFQQFLQSQSPARIEKELAEYVIGQPELVRAVADFLYYHALRQAHPDLPQRPLMISGPSGSGKTEVWRIARKLYGHLFPIRIIDGSNLSCEGWSGNYKLDTYIDAKLADGGILVVDEFDKLTKPKFSSGGDNVSLDIQSEFLKLIEGEYRLTEKKKQTDKTTEKMGFVLVGAFESLRAKKQNQAQTQTKTIGFCAQPTAPQKARPLCDEDFITYGILPEIVGRIAVKCDAKPLPDSAYVDIIRGPHSRVSQLAKVLRTYGVAVSDVVSNQALLELIAASKNNHTGVRWVSAQVESRLLDAIHEQGLFSPQAAAS